MRENMGLYRGKRKDNGEWIEGSLLKVTISGETCYLIFGDDFAFDGNDVTALSHALVDPETIGEYSGQPDKNGKKIFEGDIVETNQYGKDDGYGHNFAGFDVFHVKFAEGRFSLYSSWRRFNLCNGSNMEVIGNIHDNPELLEVEHT